MRKTILAVLLSAVCLWAGSPTLKPEESPTGMTLSDGEVPQGGMITALVYANGLVAEALCCPDTFNALKVGLASVIYFAAANAAYPDPDAPGAVRMRKYGLALLNQATDIAIANKKGYTVLWLADLWGDEKMGPGDKKRSDELRKQGQDLVKAGYRGGGGMEGVDQLLPQGYYEE